MTEASEISPREKHLLWVIQVQREAINQAGPLLSEIGESRSKYADEAWAAFSYCLRATMASDLTAPEGETVQ